MEKVNYKSLISFGMVLIVTTFLASNSAEALWIKIWIKPGHHETINGKVYCVNFGICETGYSGGFGDPPPDAKEMQSFPVNVEVSDATLTMTFKERLDKKFMYPDGKYIIPFNEDLKVSGSSAKDFGYQKFTIPKGNYEFDGSILKIKLSDVKKNEKNDRKTN